MGNRANSTPTLTDRIFFGSWSLAPVWFGLLALAVVLRMYHLPGFVLNYDEAHWLIYSLDKRLLFESLQSSRPRPDILFPLVVSVPVRLLGPNELALRLLPALAGSLSLFPLSALIFRLTGQRSTAAFGAAFLAVLPLHVYFSVQGIPDAIALLFGLCAVACLLRARQTCMPGDFMWVALWLTLALLTKAIALYGWIFLAVAGFFLFKDRRQRCTFYMALGVSVLPLAVVTSVILFRGQAMAFLHEPGVTGTFGPSFARQRLHLQYFISFYRVLLPVAVVGVVLTVVRATKGSSPDGQLLIWLMPVVNLFVTPFFRAGRTELLWLVPTVCLFAAVAVSSLRRHLAFSLTAVVMVILVAASLYGVPLPYPGSAQSPSDYTAAVLKRPGGWPSRDAARWLVAHTSPEDGILLTAFTFTDPLLLDLNQSRRVIPNAGSNWALLRDPTNRIKYVVFTQDYRGYAPYLAAYADTHFTLPADGQFPNYAIYDCQKSGRLVAYPDAYDSASPDVQRGMAFLQKHQLERATEAFEKALEVNPNHPVASANLTLLYYQLGRQTDGVALCERNIHLGMNLAISYGVLGQIREQQGDLAAAQAAYKESLKFDPKNQVTLQLLANLKARLSSSAVPPTP
ncbi:MAG TPA: glycosyltransferase family 39 protein [Verrucomicrobiae bacterium]|nr:glycosyltransferase family 39 protein [Verrucomicrobiae bacterium]